MTKKLKVNQHFLYGMCSGIVLSLHAIKPTDENFVQLA
jgi:sulfite exporter TauE/SafE